MVATTKKRTAGYIVNKTGESQRFRNFLQMTEGSHPHFATTLNQNPQTFMPLYNEHVMDNTSVSHEQEELGLTNAVKLGISTVFLLAAQHFTEPGLASYELADKFIDYQLPLLKQAGLRFIEDDKTPLMAAVWYNWVTSPRQLTILDDLTESFYDTFWLFLQPTDQARAVDFDRNAFKQAMESHVNSRVKQAPPMAPAPAAAVNDITPFGERVQNAQARWYNAGVIPSIDTPEKFTSFLMAGVDAFKKCKVDPTVKKWYKAESDERIAVTAPKCFDSHRALVAAFSSVSLLPQAGFHTKYLTAQFMEDLAYQVHSMFHDSGYKLAFNFPGTEHEVTELSVFHTWTALNSYAQHLGQAPATQGEQHLKWGAEMALIAENLAFTMIEFFEPVNQASVAKATLVDNAVKLILGFLADQARQVHNVTAPFPEQSIFVIGATDFYNNLSSIITKETEMSNANKTAAAQQNAGVAAAAAATPAVAHKSAEEIALEMMLGGLEQKFKTAIVEANKELTTELEKTFKKEVSALSKRLDAVENVLGQTADRAKLDEAGKENLKSIAKAAKEVSKESKKKKSSKRSVTGVEELTLTEKIVVGAGVGACVGAIGYGAWKLGEFLLGDE
jgi:hypothetical protein